MAVLASPARVPPEPQASQGYEHPPPQTPSNVAGSDAIARGPLPMTPPTAAHTSGPVVDDLYFRAASTLRRMAAALIDLLLLLTQPLRITMTNPDQSQVVFQEPGQGTLFR